MTRCVLFFLIINSVNTSLFAKEWRNLNTYQKATNCNELLPKDWLKKDRLQNTGVWHQANAYNLNNNLPQEYSTLTQRRDFYEWMFTELEKKQHEVIWVKMAHFISKKMHLMDVFPYTLFSKKDIKNYAKFGSEVVFNNAFVELQTLYHSDVIFNNDKALKWDAAILKKEQYDWIESIYQTMNSKDLKILDRIAKGKFLYSLLVPKEIRFEGSLSVPETRYQYAINKLRPYCKKAYQ